MTGLHTIILPQGETTIGSASGNIIVLRGSMINENHAVIITDENTTTIEPVGDSVLVINGEKISAEYKLSPNDRVIFGLNHYFVYRAAHCANDQNIVDFEDMNHEYLEKQKAEHKKELERRKREIEREKDEIKQLYAEQFDCSTHSVINDPNFLQLLDDVVGLGDDHGCPQSLGSVTEELGNLLTKITEANAVTKSSNIRFEFGFQSEDVRYVMVIRGEKYKTYWEEAYFLDMLETIILNAGSAEAETIILARGAQDEWEPLDAAPIGASIMELSSHNLTQEERGKLRRNLSRRLSSMALRMGGGSATASALGESMLECGALNTQGYSLVTVLESMLSDLLSPRHDVQGHCKYC